MKKLMYSECIFLMESVRVEVNRGKVMVPLTNRFPKLTPYR